jgi:predicted helicase
MAGFCYNCIRTPTHKDSGNPRYILHLLLSVIHVSTQTVDIVAGLPRVSFAA